MIQRLKPQLTNRDIAQMNQKTDLNTVQQAGRDAQFADDEINLFDLIKDLKDNFHWLFGFTFSFAILGVVYALVATPIYQVESKIKPAGAKYLTVLNAPELLGIYSLDSKGAFEEGKQAIFSQEYRRDYYKSVIGQFKSLNLYDSGLTFTQNYQEFNSNLKLSESNAKKDAESFLRISLELSDPEFATKFVNDYVLYSLGRRLNDIRDEIDSKRFSRIKKLEYDASLIRDTYFNNKTRRKLNLDEAQQIAKAVGQIDPVYAKSDILGSFKPPLYMYGLKALNAEEVVLTNRDKLSQDFPYGEEHFIAGLPEILFNIKKLTDIKIDYSRVELARVDEPALEPVHPIKPKKKLIVILAIIAGGFIGLMFALIIAAYKRYKTEQ